MYASEFINNLKRSHNFYTSETNHNIRVTTEVKHLNPLAKSDKKNQIRTARLNFEKSKHHFFSC